LGGSYSAFVASRARWFPFRAVLLKLTAMVNWRWLGRMFLQGHSRPTLLARATASLAAVLVLTLTVLASSPELHERLHGHQAPAAAARHEGGLAGNAKADDSDDGCIVTLFAQGVVLALSIVGLAFTGQTLRLADFAVFDRVIPEAPRYLHLPPQAPPLA
jgi:hypothetical protein